MNNLGDASSLEHEVSLSRLREYRQESQDNLTPATSQYTLTIFAPTNSNSYNPVVLNCQTREEFLQWLQIARRCGYILNELSLIE
jgi:hypothetical protein